jgi:hypothetical protein
MYTIVHVVPSKVHTVHRLLSYQGNDCIDEGVVILLRSAYSSYLRKRAAEFLLGDFIF